MTPEGEEEDEAEPVDDVEVVVNCVEIDAWFAHSSPDPEYRRGGLEEDDFDFSPPGRVSGGFIVSRRRCFRSLSLVGADLVDPREPRRDDMRRLDRRGELLGTLPLTPLCSKSVFKKLSRALFGQMGMD
jgi:hypothetical protein